ncbi:hypothetical protein [Clostridium sp. ZS2-4]|uniref:hypothetical protein n=1 Tax=Clostridium sp. ZS2-4 TaxID=2987703 RepID=UPI00227B6CD8|nr:hypothetical protein [Clostridium sp. ZS2-4]MCY6356179.1 hypothetical protein [Clostridium sp. ZS2-4]
MKKKIILIVILFICIIIGVKSTPQGTIRLHIALTDSIKQAVTANIQETNYSEYEDVKEYYVSFWEDGDTMYPTHYYIGIKRFLFMYSVKYYGNG